MLDEILQLRLANQHLTTPRLSDPTALVAHLAAVQSQDYAGAQWALGQRLVDTTRASLDRAFDAGAILRTHVLRPTWHFVAPADIRWLLALTAPRIKASIAFYDRTLGLDPPFIARSNTAIVRALADARYLVRDELGIALQRDGITVRDTQALGHIIVHAELDGIICSGPRGGKQLTYALLDERVPAAPLLEGDAALAELTRRYFVSHGPATVRDCAWWSGLTIAAVKRGIELNGPRLMQTTLDDLTYVFASDASPPTLAAAYVLPNFDEYTVAYKDRDLYYDATRRSTPDRRDVPFGNVIVLGGRVAGVWKRTLRNGKVCVQARWFDSPSDAQRTSVAAAIERHGAFLGVPAELVD